MGLKGNFVITDCKMLLPSRDLFFYDKLAKKILQKRSAESLTREVGGGRNREAMKMPFGTKDRGNC